MNPHQCPTSLEEEIRASSRRSAELRRHLEQLFSQRLVVPGDEAVKVERDRPTNANRAAIPDRQGEAQKASLSFGRSQRLLSLNLI